MELQRLQDQLTAIQSERERVAQQGLDTSILDATIRDVQQQIAEVESQQVREQVQEEEIQSITLPFDFDELFSEEGHPVTNANEMIIEVVKDVKRQANVEKNQAIDDLKAQFNAKLDFSAEQLNQLNQKYSELIDNYNNLADENISNSTLKEKAEADNAQAIRERDDAFSKRDSAFRQLQEAQETIRSLEIKLESAPIAKQALDISPSDKLAQMVKESLADKVNRGLARWNIPVLETPEIELVTEQEAPAMEIPFQPEEELRAAAAMAEGSPSGDREVETEESEVVTLESLKAEVDAIKSHLGLVA
jgi:hypothetical protein